MAQNEIDSIISGDIQALRSFLTKCNQVFEFPELNFNGRRKDFWSIVFRNLKDNTASAGHTLCLSAVRILSRDKTQINDLITEERFQTLLQLAGLVNNEHVNDSGSQINYEIVLEALKCLCNVVFNSQAAQMLCSKNYAVDGIVKRLRVSREPEIPYDVKFFDMKLLFLITALNTETRPHLKDELHGLTYLTETIDLVLREATGQSENNHNENVMEGQTSLSDDQIAILCEILKVLFNISIRSCELSVDEEDEVHYNRLVTVIHDLWLTPTQSIEKRAELQGHIVNLLTCIPCSCYDEFIPKFINGQDKEMEYEGRNMEAVFLLLKYLKTKLDLQPTATEQQEHLSAILTALNRGVRTVRIIRKYVRMHVLPPLKDVHKRPEQGDSVRNCLCRLLTSPNTHVRDLTADLLFVLCKENVSRMIKYTGYGNAAGLFATRGLMDGRPVDENRFSSESDDSDTEVYKEYRHGINPVVGCYEQPRPNPTAHMTEEQKEYEAMQLVNLMDKITRSGVMQPCRIGEDGRPEPIEHVLQLQDELPRQHIPRDTSNK